MKTLDFNFNEEMKRFFGAFGRYDVRGFVIRAIPEIIENEFESEKRKVYSYKIKYERSLQEKHLRFLHHLNVNFYHVYVRPDDPKFILVDDFDPELDIPYVKVKQFMLVVKTSENSRQGWVALSGVFPREIRLIVARQLAASNRADPGAADPDHLGRLPGTINWKKKYAPNYPITRILRIDEDVYHYVDPKIYTITSPSPRDINFEVDETTILPEYRPEFDPFEYVRTVFRKNGWTEPRTRGQRNKVESYDRSARDFALVVSFFEGQCEKITEREISKAREILYEKSSKALERGDEYVSRTIASALAKVRFKMKGGITI